MIHGPGAAPAGEPPSRRRFTPRTPAWAGRNYTLLTTAAVVAGLGSSGSLIAAAFAVLEAGGDGTDVGLVAASRTVPLVLFLLVGGAVADRLPRHRVMVAANALNCLSQGAFAVLVISGHAQLWHMAVLSALGGTGQAFFGPAAYDWLGSVAMVPVATALAGPIEDLVGRPAALWGCSALIVLLTAAVLCVPGVRNLERRTTTVAHEGRPMLKDPSSGPGEDAAAPS